MVVSLSKNRTSWGLLIAIHSRVYISLTKFFSREILRRPLNVAAPTEQPANLPTLWNPTGCPWDVRHTRFCRCPPFARYSLVQDRTNPPRRATVDVQLIALAVRWLIGFRGPLPPADFHFVLVVLCLLKTYRYISPAVKTDPTIQIRI